MITYDLVIPFLPQGHITSSIQLCEMLSFKSIIVTFMNIESNHSMKMKSYGYPKKISIGLQSSIRLVEYSNGDFN